MELEPEKLLLRIARIAYDEGRKHENHDCFPDVGMSFPKKFEDTKIYKTIMEGGYDGMF